MADEALTWSLSDLVGIERGATYKSALLGNEGPVLLGLATIEPNGGFRSGSLRRYSGSSPARMTVKPGEVYVSLKDVTQTGDLLGAAARFPEHLGQGRLTQDTVKLVAKGNHDHMGYIYWCLRTPQYREYCRAHSTGTTNLGLPRDDFLAFRIPRIDAVREVLVDVLNAIEEKIELNRRINQTLEEITRAVFRDKIVRTPRPPEWSTGRLADVLVLRYGKAMPKRRHNPGHVPVYGSGGIYGYHDTALVPHPTVIVGRKGNVGSLRWESRPSYPADTVFYVEPTAPLTFCFYLLQTLGLETMNTDAAVPGLNRDNAYRLEVPVPTSEVLNEFDAFARPIRERIDVCSTECERLAGVRDALLPSVVSNDLRTSDVERIFSETV